MLNQHIVTQTQTHHTLKGVVLIGLKLYLNQKKKHSLNLPKLFGIIQLMLEIDNS